MALKAFGKVFATTEVEKAAKIAERQATPAGEITPWFPQGAPGPQRTVTLASGLEVPLRDPGDSGGILGAIAGAMGKISGGLLGPTGGGTKPMDFTSSDSTSPADIPEAFMPQAGPIIRDIVGGIAGGIAGAAAGKALQSVPQIGVTALACSPKRRRVRYAIDVNGDVQILPYCAPRRMNPLNARALGRAARRLGSFHRIAQTIEKQIAKSCNVKSRRRAPRMSYGCRPKC